ncbi:MAG: hypothetical protein Q9209_007947 [Squamulea sp. 1 TL-2023]
MSDHVKSALTKETRDRSAESSLLAQSTKNATYLLLFQVGSRALTFVVNQILLRYLSPELLGISTQLELYSTSVLFFARESLRVALQRQEGVLTAFEVEERKISGNGPRLNKQSSKTQEVINISYLAIALGLPLAVIFASLYLRNANPVILETAALRPSLYIYVLATVLELVSEPCFAVVQQQMLYGVRASAETLATFVRCLLTCGTVVWANKADVVLGALPFAMGQMAYATVLNLVYVSRLNTFSANKSYSLLIKRIVPSSSLLLFDRFSLPRLNLAFNIYAQSVFKHLLTTGDSFLIAAFASLESQGAYALAANYGGLVARMVFQPIEESSRSFFGRLLHQSASSTGDTKAELEAATRKQVDQATSFLQNLLRFYLVICIVAVAIGPSFSPLLLSVIAGSRWSESDAPSVLAAYCYYIPLLAVNGILEAFVSAAATPAELRMQSAWMVAFSAAFVGTGFLVLEVWDRGAQGLVIANAVNMLSIFTYVRTLTSALLTTTGTPGAIQSAYTSANAGSGASAGPNPVDATLYQLLFQNGFSDQDITFAAHMKSQPYVASFNTTNGMSDPPPDEVLYEGLVKDLQTRLTKIMGNWTEFQSVLGTGDIWMGAVQGSAQFVQQWTATAPSTTPGTVTS